MKIQLKIENKNTGFIEVKNQEDNKAELVIYGDINSDKWGNNEVTPLEVKELLDTVQGKELDIYINSAGGNVFAGITIYNLLKNHTGNKRVYIEGIVASISSVIAMAGDEIYIPKNAYLMIHRSWVNTFGNCKDLLKTADLLEKLDLEMADIYKTKALESISKENILNLMDNETWFNGSEAKEYFNVNVIDYSEAVACIDGIKPSARIPSRLKKATSKQRRILEAQKREALEKLKNKLEG